MRLDLFLKLSRLVLRRSIAAEMCRAGAVRVNDAAGKPGREIKEGDIITLRRRGEVLRARIAAIPTGNIPKNQASALYEILGVEPYSEIETLLDSSDRDSNQEED